MRVTQPIRDPRKVAQIRNTLRGAGKARDYLMFSVGVNFGIRASDFLKLRVRDLFASDGSPKELFELREQKTGKMNMIGISPKIHDALRWYAEVHPDVVGNPESFLFFSSQRYPLGSQHIGRVQAWKLVSGWCNDAGLTDISVALHGMRKTMAFTALRNNVLIEHISDRLNHSSQRITYAYLGITREETMNAFLKLDI